MTNTTTPTPLVVVHPWPSATDVAQAAVRGISPARLAAVLASQGLTHVEFWD